MNQGIVYALATAFLMAIGQIFFKKSSLFIENNPQLPLIFKYLENSWLYGGVFIFGVATLLWIKAMSFGKLSTLYPIQSIAYIIVAISAYYIFGERLNLIQGVGIGVILLGIFLITR